MHSTFLLIVIGWVWALLTVRPKLPYILRMEDSATPYRGLVFLGVLGLLGVEYFEQRQLGAETKSGVPDPVSSQVKK